MRIVLITDAWTPQVNGVVRTLTTLKAGLERRGHRVLAITPDLFCALPCPGYAEVPLAMPLGARLGRLIEDFAPQAVHLATEGPLGWAGRRWCLRHGVPFTTAYHTGFPEYLHAHARVPMAWTVAALRRFHAPSRAVMVATAGVEETLRARGFTNLRRWTRGVDADLFRPRPKSLFADLPRPIFLYAGRVSAEKSVEDFLRLDLPGTKVVVGDGPQRAALRAAFPQAIFTGALHGETLAEHYASADVFVFPSRTDTFGLVILEALASGLPVAAYPVTGPRDVLDGVEGPHGVGILDTDLRAAALAALSIPPHRCRAFAEQRSWDASLAQFETNIARFNDIVLPDADAFRWVFPLG